MLGLMFVLAGFCLPDDLRPGFFVVAGGASGAVVVAGAMASVFGLVVRLWRGLDLAVPAVPNENDRFSPGTVIRVTRSPIFFARSETAGRAAGGFGLAAGGVRSPNIIVAPV
jgi:hypothetical protein